MLHGRSTTINQRSAIPLLKTRQPMQARTHIFEGEICSRMILTRVKTVHKFTEDMKATRLKDERRRQSKT